MKAITFKQFMLTFNFRYYREECKSENDKYNTYIIRIKYPVDKDSINYEWFEFGMYDYAGNHYKLQQLKKIFNNEILNMYVGDIYYQEDLTGVVVTLSHEKNIDEVTEE